MQDNASKTDNESKEKVVGSVFDWTLFMGINGKVKDFGKSLMVDSDGWAIMETESFYGD